MAVLMTADVPGQTREGYDGLLAALRDAIRAFRYGEDPEVVEYDENQGEASPAQPTDATAIAQSPPAASTTGTMAPNTSPAE